MNKFVKGMNFAVSFSRECAHWTNYEKVKKKICLYCISTGASLFIIFSIQLVRHTTTTTAVTVAPNTGTSALNRKYYASLNRCHNNSMIRKFTSAYVRQSCSATQLHRTYAMYNLHEMEKKKCLNFVVVLSLSLCTLLMLKRSIDKR